MFVGKNMCRIKKKCEAETQKSERTLKRQSEVPDAF